MLEERQLLAVTLLIDYRLDNGFFSSPERRAAIEAVAAEIGSRMNDSLAYVASGQHSLVDPRTFNQVTPNFSYDVPANSIRIFVSGSPLAGGVVGQGGFLWHTGLRRFDRATDFQPYVGYVGFDNDGSTTWNFSDGIGSGTNFQAVARHELLHVLGIGGAETWQAFVSGSSFTGPKTRAANGGVNPPVTGGHFAAGVNSLMTPVITTAITKPTAVDWAALDDIGWDVVAPPTPGIYADVIGRTASGTWMISTNTGTGLLAPTVLGQWNEASGWHDVLAGDFDGNGLRDVAGRTSDGVWWVALNTGGAFVNRIFDGWVAGAGWRDVNVGDFDNDGRDDIVGRTAFGGWYVARSTGTAFITTLWTGWSEAAGWTDVKVGDFTGDGRADIAGRTQSGEWWVGRSTGTSFASSKWTVWYAAAGWRDVMVADFNGDRRDDLVARTAYGEWYVALSLGSAFSNNLWTVWVESAGWRDVEIGDFSGSLLPDVIARTATGAWYVGTNNGNHFATTYFGYNNDPMTDVMAGQFVGSSKADIIGRTSAGTWLVGENTGSQIVFRPYGQWNQSLGWRDVDANRSYVVAAGTAPAPLRAMIEQDGSFKATASNTMAPSASNDADERGVHTAALVEALSLPPVASPRAHESTDKRDEYLANRPAFEGVLDDLFSDAGLLDGLAAAA